MAEEYTDVCLVENHLVLHLRPHVIVVRRRNKSSDDVVAELLQVNAGAIHGVHVTKMNGVESAGGEEYDARDEGEGCEYTGYFVARPGVLLLLHAVGWWW